MLKATVMAGKVDCQAHHDTCQRAGIRSYPTVRFYPYLGTTRVSFYLCSSHVLFHKLTNVLLTSYTCLYSKHKPLPSYTSPTQRDHGGEYINSQNSNVISDIIQQRLQQLSKQKEPKYKVQNQLSSSVCLDAS